MPRPDLCSGCVGCPLAENEWPAPPIGPTDAKLLVVGEAPGRQEAEHGYPFAGPSGKILRSAIEQFGLDPTAEVRYVNTVQCRPSAKNDDPPAGALAACTVLEQELAQFQGRAILAVGRIALARLVGNAYLALLQKSRSAWDGYVHPASALLERVQVGVESEFRGELTKAGKPKQTKTTLFAWNPSPPNLVGVVACIHPAAVMRNGFSNIVQMKAAVHRAVLVAGGLDVPDLHALAGFSKVVEQPHLWAVPDNAAEIDLVFDIENTPTSVTDISFAEVLPDGSIGQRGSFPWGPAAASLGRMVLGADSPYGTLVAHNAAYDCGQLEALEGIQVRGAARGERGRGLACSMMAAQIDQPDLPKALGAMWRYLLPMPPWKHRSGDNMRLYNLLDSVVTGRAWWHLRRRIAERGQRTLLQSEMASIMVLDRMTRAGMPMDVGRLRAWIDETQIEVDKLHRRWKKLTGLETHTGKKVLDLFFETWDCPVVRYTATGRPGMDENDVEKLLGAKIPDQAKAALEVHQKWAKLNKQLSTYGKGYERLLDENGYLHPSFLPDVKDSGDLGTAAGRLSSSPNVQNVDKRLRWTFRAPDGYRIGDSDLRAVEGRVQAVLADDQELLEMYDRPDFDMHGYNLDNARSVLEKTWRLCENEKTGRGGLSAFAKHSRMRLDGLERGVWPISRANMKTFLYGWNYGAGDRKIAQSLSIHEREAVAIREAYEASRPATARWRKAVVRSAAAHRLLQNAFGRIRYFPGIVPEPNVRNQAINFFPQSTVADMFWAWFPEMEELLWEFGGWLINQVHDSFVWIAPTETIPELVPRIDAIMTCEWPQIAPGFRVPASHEVGPSWGELEPFLLEDKR